MENLTSASYNARAVVELLTAHGVKDAVVSPGSRNAPLVVAVDGSQIATHVVIDERSAAFMALGMALATDRPVALICTSGSALLNYAPALAEAQHRGVPLIVVSADRPAWRVGQLDSQTITQPGALSTLVKRTVCLPASPSTAAMRRMVERDVNMAILSAVAQPCGPVHINVELEEPLGDRIRRRPGEFHPIRAIHPAALTPEQIETLLPPFRQHLHILICVGSHQPDALLQRALERLSLRAEVQVYAEAVSNQRSPRFIPFDAVNEIAPDPALVVTVGGALVSRSVKERLRALECTHWHVGYCPVDGDTFDSLAMRVEVDAALTLTAIADALGLPAEPEEATPQRPRPKAPSTSSYPAELIEAIPQGWNLQLGNGTTVRTWQRCDLSRFHRVDSNRGVSGIDGCLSTAVGMSAVDHERVTLMVAGDMSTAYDIGALAWSSLSPRFKLVVLDNGGGGIFRAIDSTGRLPQLTRYFVTPPHLPLEQLAEAYGYAYFRAEYPEGKAVPTNAAALSAFVGEAARPAILHIKI